MKWIKRIVAAIVVACVFVGIAGIVGIRLAGGVDGLSQLLVKRLVAAQRDDLFEDGRMHVFTLGTGSPQPGTGRMPAANVVIAGDEFIVIDAGEGASRTMGELFLPLGRVNTILLTHWHSDHMAGVGQVLNQSWNNDRNHAVTVYGPPGVERFMNGLARQYKTDIEYRSVGEVEHNNPEFALGVPHRLDVTPEEGLVTVFERNGVKVSVFHVDHGHIKPAYGYRVDYKGKSVVFSGDTVATPLMVNAAKGTDLLIHEAMNMRMMENAEKALRDLDIHVEADRAKGITVYHTDTIDLAKLAAEADVKKLVLTHLIPGPPNAIAKRMFTQGMSEHYGGPIVVAEDGMHFTL